MLMAFVLFVKFQVKVIQLNYYLSGCKNLKANCEKMTTDGQTFGFIVDS